MRRKAVSIPVNSMADDFSIGIAVEKLVVADLQALDKAIMDGFGEAAKQPHREDRHAFFLLENGTVQVEVDFQTYTMQAPSVIYIHPNQVHRILFFDDIVVSSLGINNENLNPDYLKLLEASTPVKPLALDKETFSILAEAVSLCLKFFERKSDRLYHSLVKDSCNALVALVLSQYLEQAKSTDKLSRLDLVTKAFRELLERNYTTIKRPAEYAQKLNISTSYLNECVKNTTGHSVSYHIQQRVVLEAKRLLYHSDKSVKEIATELGYDDYPYFTRLFTKVTGLTALTFRNNTLD